LVCTPSNSAANEILLRVIAAGLVDAAGPLAFRFRKLIMFGDAQQLPSTVISPRLKATAFERSLFERLEQLGHPVEMLRVQYRMHPQISHFPNQQFYGGQLLDGPNVETADSFQGQEARYVILSTVRGLGTSAAEPPGASESRALREGLGFVADKRRLNVAVTRAKELLIVLG
uniref:Probable helicase DDB_G0274399 n=1 Tax=Dermatophagoides pteronyssinus TaxID=6956 RepID=A0A6P6Y756_DERPT